MYDYQYLISFTCLLSLIRDWWCFHRTFLLGGFPRSDGTRMARNPCCAMSPKIVKVPLPLACQIFFLFGINLPDTRVLAQIEPLFLYMLLNWSSIGHWEGRPIDSRLI